MSASTSVCATTSSHASVVEPWSPVDAHLRVDPRAPALHDIELFGGAGGLALGLRQAGFVPRLIVESDSRCCETLRANTERHIQAQEICEIDVREVDFKEFEGVSLLSAGAPCQPFSIGGLRLGQEDHRDLFPEVIRAVRETAPRAFVLENVRGLLFAAARPYFEYVVAQLRSPSTVRRRKETEADHLSRLSRIPDKRREYDVYWRVLNAADYGLGQNRHRLVIIGMRRGDQTNWSWPEAGYSRDALIAALAADEYWETHRVPRAVMKRVQAALPPVATETAGERWRTLRDLLHDLGAPGSVKGDSSHVIVPGARLYTGHSGSRLDWPAKPIKAGVHGCPGGEHIVLEDDGSCRYLTVRECAAVQGFPDGYMLPPIRTTAMRQLGNAVPVDLARALGVHLMEVLGDG